MLRCFPLFGARERAVSDRGSRRRLLDSGKP